MAIEGTDLVIVAGDYITVDLLVWRRYRTRPPGLFEITLDINPHLARIHRTTPFLPAGTQVRIPIDPDVLRGAPQPAKVVMLYE